VSFRAVAGVFVLWIAIAAAGLGALWRYAQTPGPGADAPERWPASSRIARDDGRPTLVVFAHPKCACSRATIGELAVLMAHVPQRSPSAHVLFFRPSQAGDEWAETDLWQSAAHIPGVSVADDLDGAEAARFGSTVSGQALLYGTDGRLLFSGGITSARGHSGDNDGRTALTALLTGPASPHVPVTPVFGCSLQAALRNRQAP
jgi:hypothetical protein